MAEAKVNRLNLTEKDYDGAASTMVGEQTLDPAIFIDHQCDMLARALEQLQHFESGDSSRYKQRLVHRGLKIEPTPFQTVREQIFRVHYAVHFI